MATSNRRFSDAQRAAIYALKAAGKSARITAAELAESGYGDVAPFSVGYQTVNRIYAEMRAAREGELTELAKGPIPAGIDNLIRRAIATADRALERHTREEARGKLDVQGFRGTVAAVKDLEQLARRRPAEPAKPEPESEESAPATFLERIDAADRQAEETPEIGDVRVHAGGARYREPAKPAPAPAEREREDPELEPTPLDAGTSQRIREAAERARGRNGTTPAHTLATESERHAGQGEARENGDGESEAAGQ